MIKRAAVNRCGLNNKEMNIRSAVAGELHTLGFISAERYRSTRTTVTVNYAYFALLRFDCETFFNGVWMNCNFTVCR